MKLYYSPIWLVRFAFAVGLFVGIDRLRGEEQTVDWLAADAIVYTQHTKVNRLIGFNEFINSAASPGELPKKYRTFTWGGSVKESGTMNFVGTQRTYFTGVAQFTNGVFQNNLLRRQFRNLDSPSDEGDGSGGPYIAVGDGSGACWPVNRHNLLDEYPGTVGESLVVMTQRDVLSNTRRETRGYMNVAWSRVAFPCNLYDFQTYSDTFGSTGPISEELSLVSEPVLATDETLKGSFPNPVASLTYRMEDNSTWVPLATSPILIVDLAYDFSAIFRGICPNRTYSVKIEYDTWQGSGSNATPAVRSERRFRVTARPSETNMGEAEIKGTLSSSKMGQSIKIVAILLEKGGNCSMCAEESGATSVEVKSVHWSMNLGTLVGGDPAGMLELSAQAWSAALYTPAALTFLEPLANAAPVKVMRRADGSIRQIQTGTRLIDILTPADDTALPSGSYEVRFGLQAGSTPSVADPNLLIRLGPPIHSTRFYDPDGQGKRLTIVRYGENLATPFSRAEFSYEAATNTWSLIEGGIRRTDTVTTVLSSTEDEVLISVWQISPATVLASQVKEKYRRYVADGRTYRALVERIIDPNGMALRSTWDYVVDVKGVLRMTLFTAPSGDWRKYQYSVSQSPSSGEITRLYNTYSPFVNSSPTSSSSEQFRLAEGDVADADFDGDGRHDAHLEIYELVGGILKGIRGKKLTKLVTFNGELCSVAEEAQLLAPFFSPTDAALKWERRLTCVSGRFAGEIAYVLRPDGTLETATFSIDSATGNLTVVRAAGATDASKLAVIDGTRTTTVTGSDGRLISKITQDIITGLEVGRESVVSWDTSGHPTAIAYLDGSTEQRTYSSCCGRLESVVRRGRQVLYDYDLLGRKIMESADGIVTLYSYDALDRVTNVVRRGSDGTEVVQQTTTYDLAGRVTRIIDAVGRITAYDVVFNGDRTTRRTTTYPDQSTLIEIDNADGTRNSTGGTRGNPSYLEYAISNVNDIPCIATTEFKGEVGTSPAEWIKRYRDGWGREVKVEFPGGASESNIYDAAGRLVQHKDADNVTTLWAYNARGERDTTAIDMNGNNAIDPASTDRLTKTVSVVATKTDASVNYTVLRSTTQLWETDGADTPVTVAISEQSSDGLRVWQTTRGLTSKSVTAFDGSGGRTVTTTTPDGVKTIQVYSGDRLVSNTVKTAADVQLSALTYAYDPHGRLLTATDARNGATTFTYFADDRTNTVVTADPDTTKSGPGYDAQTTTYTYDSAGRVSSVTQPDGGVVTTTYWPTGSVKRTSGARTYPIEYTYDPQGRVKTLTTWQNFAGDSGKAVTTWNYDAARGFLLNKRYADNTGPSYTYKPSGRLLTRAWARTPVVTTTYSYNAAGDLTGTDYSDATPDVTLTYDRAGRTKTVGDASGARTLAYHASGQLEDETYTAGLLNGFVIDRSFDSLYRLSGILALNSQPSTLNSATYSYDAASRLDTVTSGANTATYGYLTNSPLVESVIYKNNGTTRLTTTKAYDKLNRLTSISSASSVSSVVNHSYTYNAANQRTRVTREDNAYWSYGYDALGQVTSGKKFLAGDTAIPGHDYAWTFDDIGNRKTATTNGAASIYTPNSVNQYTQRTVTGAIDVLGAAAATATVTVGVNGGTPQATTRQGELFYKQVTVSNSSTPQNASLKITGVKNLAGPNQEDAIAEITKTAFVAQTPEGFTYDADGNLVDDARWHYTWDGEDRLIAVETSASAASAGVTKQKLEFAYDAQGRRFSKKVYDWNTSSGLWTLSSELRFLYDGWNLLAELNALSSNAVLRTYTWGLDLSGGLQGAGGVGGLLSIADAASTTTHFAAYDGNGSVAALTKAADGTVTAKYDYNAFGEPTAMEGSFAGGNPFRFSTKYTDAETGHLYYGYRCYAPDIGRWLSKDPIEEQGGVNLYGMVGNDAVNQWDDLGLIVGSVTVPVFSPYTTQKYWFRPSTRGWAIQLRWEPPSEWRKLGTCRPCEKVVWLQDATDTRGGLFKPDITMASYKKVGYAWEASNLSSTGAGMADVPSQNGPLFLLKSPYQFYAKSYAKCMEGPDAGKIYATVLWGYTWVRDSAPKGLGPQIY